MDESDLPGLEGALGGRVGCWAPGSVDCWARIGPDSCTSVAGNGIAASSTVLAIPSRTANGGPHQVPANRWARDPSQVIPVSPTPVPQRTSGSHEQEPKPSAHRVKLDHIAKSTSVLLRKLGILGGPV